MGSADLRRGRRVHSAIATCLCLIGAACTFGPEPDVDAGGHEHGPPEMPFGAPISLVFNGNVLTLRTFVLFAVFRRLLRLMSPRVR